MIVEYKIENKEGIFIQEIRQLGLFNGAYSSKLKKGKLLKITILDEQEGSVQSADRTKAMQVWSWGNM